jgi:hypothetical protein
MGAMRSLPFRSRRVLTCCFCAVPLAIFVQTSGRAATGPTREGAQSAKQKVAAIAGFAERPVSRPQLTTVTEQEVNSYLAFEVADQIPPGVVQPEVTIVGDGRLSARAVVDLDAVRRQNGQRGLFDPLNYLTGKVPVSATGVLRAANGMGQLELETAAIGPVPVPKLVLQEIVGYYSRTAEKPSGIVLDDPFNLPARIREIRVEPGQAVVVQ